MGMSPKEFAEIIADYVRPLRVKIDALERELEDVKKSAPRHTGKFEAGRTYSTGEECAWRGSTWRAKYDGVSGEPPGPGWWLVAKGAG